MNKVEILAMNDGAVLCKVPNSNQVLPDERLSLVSDYLESQSGVVSDVARSEIPFMRQYADEISYNRHPNQIWEPYIRVEVSQVNEISSSDSVYLWVEIDIEVS